MLPEYSKFATLVTYLSAIHFHSDTVYLETASDPTAKGLGPTRPPAPHSRRQSQVQADDWPHVKGSLTPFSGLMTRQNGLQNSEKRFTVTS